MTGGSSKPDQQWVINQLVEVVERTLHGEEFHATASLRALELIGKHLQMFGAKTGDNNVLHKEWLEKVTGYAKRN